MLDVSDTKEYAVITQLCISTQYQSSNDSQGHIMRCQISEVLISPAGSYIGLFYSNWALKTLYTTYLIHTFTQELFFFFLILSGSFYNQNYDLNALVVLTTFFMFFPCMYVFSI